MITNHRIPAIFSGLRCVCRWRCRWSHQDGRVRRQSQLTDPAVNLLNLRHGSQLPLNIREIRLTRIEYSYEKVEAARLAHFSAHALHESGCLRYDMENLNYPAKARRAVFGKYFKTDEEEEAYARKPERLTKQVNGGVNGLTHRKELLRKASGLLAMLEPRASLTARWPDLVVNVLVSFARPGAESDMAFKAPPRLPQAAGGVALCGN